VFPRLLWHLVEPDASIAAGTGRHPGRNQTDPLYTGVSTDAFPQSSVERGAVFTAIYVAGVDEYRHAQQSLGAKSQIGLTQRLVRAQQQTGTDYQYGRQCDFGDNQPVFLPPRAQPRATYTAMVFNGGWERAPQGAQISIRPLVGVVSLSSCFPMLKWWWSLQPAILRMRITAHC